MGSKHATIGIAMVSVGAGRRADAAIGTARFPATGGRAISTVELTARARIACAAADLALEV